jgi:thioredoxin 1
MLRSTLSYIKVSLLTAGFSLFTCSATFAQTDVKLSPDAFEKALSTTPNAQLLDVRTKEEYDKEHLNNALNSNFNGPDFEKEIAFLDKSKPAYVYCLSGGRSAKAAALMRENGFTQVYELNGGIQQWNSLNKPIEKSPNASDTPGMSAQAFEQLLQSEKLVLVDFSAQWSLPSKKMAPILEKVSTDLPQQVSLVKLDVDNNPALAKLKKITMTPTLFLYKDQKLVWQQTGFVEEAALRKVVGRYTK